MLRLALTLTIAVAFSLALAPAALAAPYAQAVDNASPRFSASAAWKTSSWSSQKAGKDYRYAQPGPSTDAANFKIKVPKTGKYRVFARWPATGGYNTSTPVGVVTTSGLEWRRVDQSQNGGKWRFLGVHELRAGDSNKVKFSRRTSGKGYVIADAVRVAEVEKSASPPPDSALTRRNVLREAETWRGVPYRYGGSSRQGVDCSGLTLRVFEKFGLPLPRTAEAQYDRGRAIRDPRDGDLVFGDYSGSNSVEHVGIYAGDGKMLNAPYPGTVVRYDPISPDYHIGYRDIIS